MIESARLAASCLMFTGVAYLAYSVLFFFDPCRRSRSAHEFMKLFGEEPRFYLWRARVLGAGSIVALAALPALSRVAGGGDLVWWVSILALIGFAANALSNLRSLQILPVVLGDYRTADDAVKIALARTTSYVSLDPRGWFTFGGFGVWLIVINLLATMTGAWPTALGVLGVVLGALLVLVVPAGVFHRYAIFSGVAATAGTVLAPVWFVAAGVVLL
jgi:hypothetical protein